MDRAGLGRGMVAAGITLLLAGGFGYVASRTEKPVAPPRDAQGPPLTGTDAELERIAKLLEPLHRSLPPPRPGDWRTGPGSEERGQTFRQWRGSRPTVGRGRRRAIYVQRIGEIDPGREEILDLTTQFLGIYFGLPIRHLDPVAVGDEWPVFARRSQESRLGEQLRTTYILQNVLAPALPDDAAVLVGLTGWDLWPGEGWNYVFGQASLRQRVSVWSLRRFGDPGRDRAAKVTCLRRTLKVATHETGHMFSILHCLAYACNMCGSNNLDETDRHPLALCPECLAKVCAATGTDPHKRFVGLAAFCTRHGLDEEADLYRRSAEAIRAR